MFSTGIWLWGNGLRPLSVLSARQRCTDMFDESTRTLDGFSNNL